jgi:hypothetical protein
MMMDSRAQARLQRIVQLARKELSHLKATDGRLFAEPFTAERARQLDQDLDLAERLGLISDAQAWLDMRRVRNQMVHEYIEEPVVLASAPDAGHAFVPELAAVAARLGA